MRVRTQLVLLVAGALLPVAIFAGIMTARFWELQREAYSQQFLERVRALRLALDTELEATVRTLRALGESTDLTEPRPDLMAARLRHLVDAQPGWDTMGVLPPDGAPVVQVFRDGDAGPTPDRSTVSEVLSTRAPVISDLVKSADRPIHMTYVAVPVMRDGAVKYVLYAGIDHRAWLQFLRKYPIAEGATLTLNDRKGAIIARTLNDERWVGQLSSSDFRERAQQKREDTFRSLGLEGQAFYSAFSHLAASGWTLGTGVPQEEVESALRGSSIFVVAGIAIASILAVLLALSMGRRIAGDIGWLSGFAKRMADPDHAEPSQGRMPEREARNPFVQLAMTEAQSVRDALEETDRQLIERQGKLNAAIAREAQARATAENANRAKDQFLAMLGHELRNPLSAIATAAALLEASGDGKHLSRSIEIIRRQVRHLTAIVNELLDAARITSGKVVLAREILDLAGVARHAVIALQDAGRASHATIVSTLEEALVYADETRLEQIVTNIIDNALKYSAHDAEITITVGPRGDDACLEVRDNGKGIAPELLPRVFDLFEQGERTPDRAQGGLGVGLTVVRSLVEQHGGSVVVVSPGEGQGCIVTVTLPRVKAAPGHAAAPLPAPDPASRILVVDDNADNRNTLAELLRSRGHEVAVAVDGPDAMRMLLEMRPWVGILDIGLPGFDGLEVARLVRAHPDLRLTTLIALSGYGSDVDRAAAALAGFDAYMIKPFDLAEFQSLTASAPRGR